MQDVQINHFAVIVAAFSAFVLGGLWYSPMLFAKGWMKANGFDASINEKGNPAVIFSIAFIMTLILSYTLGFFLAGPETTMVVGIQMSALSGVGLAVTSLFVIAMFERRPPAYFAINGGYIVLMFVIMGALIGGWR